MRIAFWIVAAELLFAWAASWSVGHYAHPPVASYLVVFAKLLVGLGTLVLIRELILMRGAPNPVSVLCRRLSDNRDLVYVVAATAGLCVLQKITLTWIKPALPMANGFWADNALANADAALFGADPWRIAHAIAGPSNVAIDYVYFFWGPFALVLLLAAASRNAAKLTAVVSYFLVFAFSIVLQFALPSAGPIFWQRLGLGDRFVDLGTAIPPTSTKISNYLWENYLSAQEGFAVGISAFPSVHVASATWVAITVRALWPKLFPLAAAWWALIAFGSVYLGWHYVIDGIAGTIIALAAWKSAQIMLQARSTMPRVAVG